MELSILINVWLWAVRQHVKYLKKISPALKLAGRQCMIIGEIIHILDDFRIIASGKELFQLY